MLSPNMRAQAEGKVPNFGLFARPSKCFSCADIHRFVYWPTLSGRQSGI
jgi:hypothetical protein